MTAPGCGGEWEQPAGVEERCSASTVCREATLRPRVCLVRGSQFGGRESPGWDLEVQCVGLEGFAVRTGGLAGAGPFRAPGRCLTGGAVESWLAALRAQKVVKPRGSVRFEREYRAGFYSCLFFVIAADWCSVLFCDVAAQIKFA